MSTHEQFQELLGAYALDAMEGEERLLLEDHLGACAECREEVQRHREVAAHLAYADEAAPEHLWARIASALRADEPPEPLGVILPLSGRGRRRWAPAGLVAAAAVVAAALAVLGWQVDRQNGRVDRLRVAVSAPGMVRAADAAMADPHARVAVLASGDGRVQVTGVLEPDGSGYLLRAGALPALPSGETYQLWGVAGAEKISLGVLGPNPQVVAFHAVAPSLSALAITAEQGPGVVRTAHTPVVLGRLPPV